MTAERTWRDAPVYRLVGAFVSWALFTACFWLLFAVATAVMALGGTCASGGPYVIEVECPESVVLFAPLSIFGGFAAVGVSLLLARGFGAPVWGWAWPVLFVGLGIPFLLTSLQGSTVGAIVGILFVLMGIAPLALALRQPGTWQLVLGSRDVRGRPFSAPDRTPWGRLTAPRAVADAPVRPGAGDWALSLGTVAVAIACGLALGAWLWALAL